MENGRVEDIDKAVYLLVKLQWAGRAHGFGGCTNRRCVLCEGMPEGDALYVGGNQYIHGQGHKENCELGQFLKQEIFGYDPKKGATL